MNTITLPGETLLGAIFIAGIVGLGWFLSSYMKRKGQNYADKRDIGDITDKIEEVKNQYAVTLSLINANLGLISKGLESYEAEAFKSYVAYHEACAYILNDVANIDFTKLTIKDIGFLNSYGDTVMEAYKRLRQSKANHDLFADVKELREKADNLFQACVDYVGKLSVKISQVAFCAEQADSYNKQGFDLITRGITDERLKQIVGYHQEYRDSLESARLDIKKYVVGEDFSNAIRSLSAYQLALRSLLKHDREKLINAPKRD